MNLQSISISHHSADLEVREKMWFSNDEARELITALKEKYFDECMIVSTCNRTELYGLNRNAAPNELDLKKVLIDFKKAGNIVRPEHFTSSYSRDAIDHLFHVVSGIDSMIIGDVQILNQVKEAFQASGELGCLGPVMNRLMQSTLHVGKRTRSETSICEGAVSVSYAAVELASKIFEDLSKKSVLLIGAGETGELTLKHLASKGISQIKIANRTREKAETLAAAFGASIVDYSNISEALKTVDIVITSVSSPSYVVEPAHAQEVMKKRLHNPLFIIDIGVPRNVNPATNKVDNVFLYDIDSLSGIVDKNLEKRKIEIPNVKNIIEEEIDIYFRWYNALGLGPTIQEFREALESIRKEEVEKNINRFKSEDRELVDLLTKRIVNKILHQPITTLKHGAENGKKGTETLYRLIALRDLFGISVGDEKKTK